MKISVLRPSFFDIKEYTPQTIFVIIDTFRATTSLSALKNSGVKRFYVVKNKEDARLLKQELFPDCLLIGEEGGHKIDGFDFGNSPSAFTGKDLSTRRVIFTSSNGAQTLLLLENMNHVYLAALVNLSKVVATIVRSVEVERTSVVVIPSGVVGDSEHLSIEDWVTAYYLVKKITKLLPVELCIEDIFWEETKKILQDTTNLETLLANTGAGKYITRIGYGEDIPLASKLDVFDNFLKVKKWGNFNELKYVELE